MKKPSRNSVKKKKALETCPKCGVEINPEDYEVVECPKCGVEGCTRYCVPGGSGCMCVECEEQMDEELR